MSLKGGEVKRTVLCFVFDRARNSLLMIQKKRGQGAGKVNVPGGKIAAGESAVDAAIRETEEETGIVPSGLEEAGILEFYFPESQSWDNTCTVFTAESFSGDLIPETEECSVFWENLDRLPMERMWDSDRIWLPLLLSGKRFHRSYTFDKHDKVAQERVLG
ncbi:MAG TPA: 8-oxo-dGTP diphosphatase [Bdellovibrionota bacterium]|jgi:8-oxo-dGTP diphosphatase